MKTKSFGYLFQRTVSGLTSCSMGGPPVDLVSSPGSRRNSTDTRIWCERRPKADNRKRYRQPVFLVLPLLPLRKSQSLRAPGPRWKSPTTIASGRSIWSQPRHRRPAWRPCGWRKWSVDSKIKPGTTRITLHSRNCCHKFVTELFNNQLAEFVNRHLSIPVYRFWKS